MPVRLQSDFEPLSKASTIYLGSDGGSGWSDLAGDLSQRFTDLTPGASSATEAAPASDRFDVSHPRTIGAVVSIDETTTGVVFAHGSGGDLLRLDLSPAGTLRATQNGAVVGSIEIPNVGNDPTSYVLAWVSRANPLATGSDDAVQSWLLVYDEEAEELSRVAFAHAAKASASGTATWGGASPATFSTIWYASAAQSASEILRDLGHYSPTPPASSCDLALPPIPFGRIDSAVAENAWYGPLPQWAAVHARHALRRHWSPLANATFRDPPTLRGSVGPGLPGYRLAPGSSSYRFQIGWLAPAPVPPGATHAWVRVQVRLWVVSGTPVPFGVRIYSMSRLPDDVQGGPLEVRQVGEVLLRNDGASGAGQWDVEQLLELAVGNGWTYLCPAFAVDPAGASANDDNCRAQIRAFHAVPCVAE